ncbi:MAG: hypothetical protein QM648_03320 [Solirubrobacterales bacterium]
MATNDENSSNEQGKPVVNKRASMREGPLAALFRKTEPEAEAAAPEPEPVPARTSARAASTGPRTPPPSARPTPSPAMCRPRSA